MNLNGGYTMLDLDNTSGLVDRASKAYDSGKPLIIKKDDRLQFANFIKRVSTSSNYQITLSDNTRIDIHAFNGTVTYNVVAPIYRHNIFITGTMGVSRTISFSYYDTSATPVASTNISILEKLASRGHDTANTSALLSDSATQFANVYITKGTVGNLILHIKPNGATQWTEVTNLNSLTTVDKVTRD